MNEQDYQTLSSYLDGELDEHSAQRLEHRLASEPELQDTLKRLKALNERLQQSCEVADAVPAHVAAMVQPLHNNVVNLTPRRARPTWQYAVAASLVAAAGLALAPQWQANQSDAPTLAMILETTPSSATAWASLDDGRQVRPVLSFRSVNNRWCREYLVTMESAGERGVACRENGAWEVQVTSAATIPGSASEFRPAGAGDADAVAGFLAEQAGDIALSADEEKAMIDADWER